jgi:hypothetical protein
LREEDGSEEILRNPDLVVSHNNENYKLLGRETLEEECLEIRMGHPPKNHNISLVRQVKFGGIL